MFESLIFSMMMWISLYTGLPMTNDIPKVYSAERSAMCYLKKQEEDCNVAALYAVGRGEIIIRSDFPPGSAEYYSLLTHELTHYLIDVNKKEFECIGAEERFAYDVQKAWLEHAGYDEPYRVMRITPGYLMVLTSCGGPQ